MQWRLMVSMPHPRSARACAWRQALQSWTEKELWLCPCRYVYHTLKNSVNTVPTIAQADAIYVYDYCYVMWALGDHHAAGPLVAQGQLHP